MARLDGAEAQHDKLRRVGLMLRAMTSGVGLGRVERPAPVCFPLSAPVSVTVNSIERESETALAFAIESEIAIAIENVIVLDTVSHF
jgi:hypothetical protein